MFDDSVARPNRLLTLVVAGCCTLCVSSKAASDVLRSATFDQTRDLSELEKLFPGKRGFHIHRDRRASVDVVPNPSGDGYVLRSRITPSEERAEVRAGRDAVGSERWYGWSLYLPPDYQEVRGKSDILFQWHRGGGAPRWAMGHPMCFMINERGNFQLIWTYQTDPKDPTSRVNQSKDLGISYVGDRGHWVHWALHARWSVAGDGYLGLYRNGRQLWERKGPNWLSWGPGPMVKCGIYTGNPGWRGNNPTIVYHDNIIVGDENSGIAEVNPALSSAKQAGLKVEDLGKEYTPDPKRVPAYLQNDIPDKQGVCPGNTSFRNESPETLVWKGRPNANGYGYFQRNRDLGQIVNIPEGVDIQVDAIVLRTSRGNNAMMAGAPGAPVYVQLFEVHSIKGEQLRIDDNGTPVGTRSTHGFDRNFSRTDDHIEGVRYVPIARATGGKIPREMPVTTQAEHDRGRGEPFGEQAGHLRYMRWDLLGNAEWVLRSGKRYAFLVGFEESGKQRGIALAISTTVHQRKAPEFVRDSSEVIRWGIRREGNGKLPPTMVGAAEPPADIALREKLVRESVFAPDHWDRLMPTSEGYPDVDTYRTLQFYVETRVLTQPR